MPRKTYVHRATFEVLRHVDDHRDVNFPPEEGSRDPTGLEALVTARVPRRYWAFDPPGGDALRELSPAEKAIVDADTALVEQARSERRQELFGEVASFIDRRYSDRVRGVFGELRVGATGAVLARLNEYFTWHRSVWVAYRGAITAINAATDVVTIQNVSVDIAPLIASDPLVGPDQL